MKNFIMAAIAFTIFTVAVAQPVEADSWVKCQDPVTGETQMFRGMSCPFGWIPV